MEDGTVSAKTFTDTSVAPSTPTCWRDMKEVTYKLREIKPTAWTTKATITFYILYYSYKVRDGDITSLLVPLFYHFFSTVYKRTYLFLAFADEENESEKRVAGQPRVTEPESSKTQLWMQTGPQSLRSFSRVTEGEVGRWSAFQKKPDLTRQVQAGSAWGTRGSAWGTRHCQHTFFFFFSIYFY